MIIVIKQLTETMHNTTSWEVDKCRFSERISLMGSSSAKVFTTDYLPTREAAI